MTINNILRLSLVMFMSVGAQTASGDSGKAVVNGDYVRVRARPNTEAAPAGFLYKNMVVEIKTQTPDKQTIGNDSFYWYEVKGGDVRGWVYGKFLSPNVADVNLDTYDAPGDTQWLSRRFGDSTWYYNQKMDMRSFSLDDYRNLMRAAQDGNEQAWVALRVTILNHLKDNPNDPDYAYLKRRLYSDGFLLAVMNHGYAYNDPNFFEVVPYSRDLVAAALKRSTTLVPSIPDEYWNDKEIVLLVLNGTGCSSEYTGKVSAGLARDPAVKAVLDRCRAQR